MAEIDPEKMRKINRVVDALYAPGATTSGYSRREFTYKGRITQEYFDVIFSDMFPREDKKNKQRMYERVLMYEHHSPREGAVRIRNGISKEDFINYLKDEARRDLRYRTSSVDEMLDRLAILVGLERPPPAAVSGTNPRNQYQSAEDYWLSFAEQDDAPPPPPPPPPPPLTLHIIQEGGPAIFVMQVQQGTTILEIKQFIKAQLLPTHGSTNIYNHALRIIYKGREIENNRTIGDVPIPDNDSVYFVFNIKKMGVGGKTKKYKSKRYKSRKYKKVV